MLKAICLSDSHTRHRQINVPYGDILIHCGDISCSGRVDDIRDYNSWLGTLPHKYKVQTFCNHDKCCADIELARKLLTNCTCLIDEEVTIEGLRIYGSPYHPNCGDFVFGLSGQELKDNWAKIPNDIDVLITHGPPLGRGDRVCDGLYVGDAHLLDAVRRVRPRFHAFGHVHEDKGMFKEEFTTFINCSIDLHNKAIGQPVVFYIEPRQ